MLKKKEKKRRLKKEEEEEPGWERMQEAAMRPEESTLQGSRSFIFHIANSTHTGILPEPHCPELTSHCGPGHICCLPLAMFQIPSPRPVGMEPCCAYPGVRGWLDPPTPTPPRWMARWGEGLGSTRRQRAFCLPLPRVTWLSLASSWNAAVSSVKWEQLESQLFDRVLWQ